MFLVDRLFVPCRRNHDRRGSARAAARNLAFGAGGFSSRSRTRRLSRAESCTRSASSMTALAARNACRMTKSVRSVWFSATARIRSAFSSARIRKDIRLLSSTASLGIPRLPNCTHSNSTALSVASQSRGGRLARLSRRLKTQPPAQLFLIEPGDFRAEPARLHTALKVLRIDGGQHERAWPFPKSLDPRRQPRPAIQRLRQHHRQIAQQRQVAFEIAVHLLDRPRHAVSLPVARDGIVQVAHRNHYARHPAELPGQRLAPRPRPFVAG